MMKIIALLSIAVCAGTTSVQAQVAQDVVVQHADQGLGGNAGVYFGCCDEDVSDCFDVWSNYCQERRGHLACSPRRAMHAQGCSTCGIFDFNLCGCKPLFGKCAPSCESPGCEGSDDCVGSGCDHQITAPGAEPAPQPAVEPMPPLDSTDDLDSAEDVEPSPSDVQAPGEQPPMPPEPKSSAGRWYLPFKWKK